MSVPSRGSRLAYGKDVEEILLKFWPNGSSTTTLTRVDETADATAGGFCDFGGGVASVQRTSNAGEFTVTLEERYVRFVGAWGKLHLSSPNGTYEVNCSSPTNEAGSAALTFLCRIFQRAETAPTVTAWNAIDLNSITPDAQNDIEALPTLTDSPANVDALRDDLTTNWQSLITINDATIAEELNAARTIVSAMTSSTVAGTDVSAATTSFVCLQILVTKSKVPR